MYFVHNQCVVINMIKKWYTDSYRRNLVDMHIEVWNDEFLSKFDPVEYYNCIKAGKIQNPMIYLQSHVGYCNWPTKSGEMHPAFNGVDKIKQIFDLCNNDGMEVIAYYSLIYNNWAYDKYPDWRIRGVKNEDSRSETDRQLTTMMFGRGRYGLVCPNNEEYREFLKLQFAEFCENYNFPGIFLDMTFWPQVCYCDSCRKRYLKETGKEMPMFVDWSDPEWIESQKVREYWLKDFAEFTTAELKKIQPEMSVEHQFSTATHPWTYGVRTSVSDASDYTGGDLYGGFEQQSFIQKLYYSITNNHPFEYMTSRCDPGLTDHTTTKSDEMLKLHTYLTHAHRGAMLVIDAIDPRGTMNKAFYERLGRVFDETSKYEPFLKGKLKSNTGLYFSFGSKMVPELKAIDYRNQGYPHLKASSGAAKALRRNHIPYAMVADSKTEQIYNYEVIVLSDVCCLEEHEENILLDYIKNGGNAYFSSAISPRLLKEIFGMKHTGNTIENLTYMRPLPKYEALFSNAYNENFPMTVFGTQVMLETETRDNEIIAYTTLPYTDPMSFDKFSSIHSNPPGIDTMYPAIMKAKYGKGTVIWSAAAFESSEQPMHKEIFSNLVRSLYKNDLVKTDAHPCVEITVFDDENTGTTYVNCINIQEQFPIIPCDSFKISVHREKAVSSVKLIPNGEELEFIYKDGYVTFELPRLYIFEMLEIN